MRVRLPIRTVPCVLTSWGLILQACGSYDKWWWDAQVRLADLEVVASGDSIVIPATEFVAKVYPYYESDLTRADSLLLDLTVADVPLKVSVAPLEVDEGRSCTIDDVQLSTHPATGTWAECGRWPPESSTCKDCRLGQAGCTSEEDGGLILERLPGTAPEDVLFGGDDPTPWECFVRSMRLELRP